MRIFGSFDLLLPKALYLKNWPVIACDQFTSNPSYWENVKKRVGDAPSAFNIILPEAFLEKTSNASIARINSKMKEYLAGSVFDEYKDSYVYVERTISTGETRRGMLGVIDLENYDFRGASDALVRPTEGTLRERIPSRVAIRKGAVLESSHVILFCDDSAKSLLEPPFGDLLYDMELPENGGRVRGFLVKGCAARIFEKKLSSYEKEKASVRAQGGNPFYLVGDGNHSLAAAKTVWENLKKEGAPENHPARFAMAELQNIREGAESFEPIHRILSEVDTEKFISRLKELSKEGGEKVSYAAGALKGDIYIKGGLPSAVISDFIDGYISAFGGKTDYIHGKEEALRLSEAEGFVAVLLPPVQKSSFFSHVKAFGAFPRKTFSVGEARDKRYYIECRRIFR